MMNIMKNAILSLAMLLLAVVAFGQSERTPAQQMTDKLTEKYNLTEEQQAEMLTIQQRTFNDLEEIAHLKKSNVSLHIQKMRALKMGMEGSMERIFNADQRAILAQEKAAFRQQKSVLYSDLKAKGASALQIDYQICQLEEAALTGTQ